MALSLAWWSWQAVLNFNHISIKLLDSNILVSLEAGQGNCLPYVLVPFRFSASQEDRDKNKNIKKINNINKCHKKHNAFDAF